MLSITLSGCLFVYSRTISILCIRDVAFTLCRSEVTGRAEAVQTSKNILYGRKAVVVASGAWTRSLLHSFLGPNSTLDIPVKPRKVCGIFQIYFINL